MTLHNSNIQDQAPAHNKEVPIHLWTYNHPLNGITDQIDFFKTSFTQAGYAVSVSNEPSISSLNVVIENFTPKSRDTLIQFCNTHKKRVAIIMTEHLDYAPSNGELYIHGDRLNTFNDYMDPATQIQRIQHLIECRPYIRCFFTLGDLPELKNISTMLPGLPIRKLPFSKLDKPCANEPQFKQDLVFTGIVTSYREQVLASLRAHKFSLYNPSQLVEKKKYEALNESTKIILNIPQRKTWRWLSSMRIIAALRSGRATISLNTKDTSKISECCTQLDLDSTDWQNTLSLYIEDWQHMYNEAYDKYHTMASSFAAENPFPHELFKYWAIMENIEHSHSIMNIFSSVEDA
jgi:hypothetical protein